MYTKQEAIEAINRGEKFKDKKFNQVRDDLDIALAVVSRMQSPLFVGLYAAYPANHVLILLFTGIPQELAATHKNCFQLELALRDTIKIRDLEVSFQKSLDQKSAPRRTIKI